MKNNIKIKSFAEQIAKQIAFTIIASSCASANAGIEPQKAANLDEVNLEKKPCLNIVTQNATESLDDIMVITTRNAQVKSFVDLVEASKYTLKSSKQYYLPKLVASGSYAYYSTPTSERILENGTYVKSTTSPKYIEVAPSITLNQNLLNLSQQSLIASNYFNLKSQQYQTQSQALSNALSAAQLYNSIVQNYNTALSIKKVVNSYKEQYESTFKLKKAGEASLIDLLSAKAQVELYEQQLLQYRANVVASIANLQTLLNQKICTIKTDTYLNFPTIEKIPNPTQKDKERAFLLSPQINIDQAASKSNIELAKYYRRTYLPTLSIQAGMTGTYEFGNLSGTGRTNGDYYLNSEPYAQLTINWTLYDGGTNLSLANSQIENSKSNLALANQSRITLENNIENYWKSDVLNTQSLKKASSQLKINEKLIELVSIGYKAGYLTYLNFQVQAGTLYNSYVDLFNTTSLLLNNRLQFYSLYLFPDFKKTYTVLSQIPNN